MNEMSDGQIRIAVAKLMGIQPERRWRFFYDEERQHGAIGMESREVAKRVQAQNVKWWTNQGMTIPQSDVEEYDEWSRRAPRMDLNACAEMEETLTGDEREHFWEHLQIVISGEKDDFYGGFDLVHSTARQRCLAFLKTKGAI